MGAMMTPMISGDAMKRPTNPSTKATGKVTRTPRRYTFTIRAAGSGSYLSLW
ncbi:MAG: hypothetical protein BWX50_01323 [Euryarchaeota archaeon ADurb.Bin009]|nr:MAG: hypothetical protein BWX50_01323 [Euryarchaeota archaeon ADurb.Bin009]